MKILVSLLAVLSAILILGLIHMSRALKKARKEASDARDDADAVQNKFLLNISHDIRTPMNAVLGFANMARKYSDNPQKVIDCIDKIELSGMHLLDLLNDILDMSRIESGLVKIEELPVNFRLCSDEMVEIIRGNAESKGINFVYEFENLVSEEVFADPVRLNQVLLNILSNAIKFTPEGGTVTYTIEQLGSNVPGYGSYKFIIKDTGVGIKKEFLNKIFDTFSRERSSTQSGIQGAGVGMSIAKRLVDLMGGAIEVRSEVNVGTIVIVSLNFRLQSIAKYPEELIEELEDIDFAGKRVLLVEDNDLNREIARDFLEEKNLIVEEAVDGVEAVNLMREKEAGYYDMILMDIQMPNMNGYQATETIRSLPDRRKSSIPIAAMTANAFEEDRQMAFAVGMNAFISKPLNLDKLNDVLQKYC
ncbi:MAG: response regulator [Treponema sp.]|nr:response regulator [Treponema sp.]